MREIKFRAWDEIDNKMVKIARIDFSDGMAYTHLFNGIPLDFWNDCILEQFTGLHDKNGVENYDGDIVEAWSQGIKAKGEIKQRIDGTWIMFPCWQNSEMWYLMPNDNGETTVEVIGNIHESEDK